MGKRIWWSDLVSSPKNKARWWTMSSELKMGSRYNQVLVNPLVKDGKLEESPLNVRVLIWENQLSMGDATWSMKNPSFIVLFMVSCCLLRAVVLYYSHLATAFKHERPLDHEPLFQQILHSMAPAWAHQTTMLQNKANTISIWVWYLTILETNLTV